ncbi:MAG TPA: DNA polymerase IV [Candidatus Woesearchaeota archaeon]|nr:DNA polymerase IV [Candidatus Woesearchaeota archaeon]
MVNELYRKQLYFPFSHESRLEMLVEKERKRLLKQRIIMHIDMDYFYAQVEERDNPKLKDRPVIVGADPKKGMGRGVVSTCNYLARERGVKSGMPISRAYRLCPEPECVYLRPRIDYYTRESEILMQIIVEETKAMVERPKFEQVSIDELYIDVSSLRSYKRAKELAKLIKRKIKEKRKLTCSIGIGPNKLIAKIASDYQKPDGLTVVKPNDVDRFLVPLDVDALYGVGPKTKMRLNALGIKTVGDLRRFSLDFLKQNFGKFGEDLYLMAKGIDLREVVEGFEIKSIGKQHTFEYDTRDLVEIRKVLLAEAKAIDKELNDFGLAYRTVTITVRFEDFETHTKSKTFALPQTGWSTLLEVGWDLFKEFYYASKKRIRLVGLRASRLVELSQLKVLKNETRRF